jgi:hypothetical protein
MRNTDARARAEMLFARKLKMQTESQQAAADYRNKQEAELAKTRRLRKLRLERPAAR